MMFHLFSLLFKWTFICHIKLFALGNCYKNDLAIQYFLSILKKNNICFKLTWY